jgi:multidrug transporter EmrE-like cation transporter
VPAAEITLPVTLAVLGAGFLHALWNAMLKQAAGDPLLDTALIVAGGSIVALALLPLVGAPDRAAWPFMVVSAVIHFGYYVTLAGAYRRGDLSFAYPLMRGVAPLIVTVLGIVFLGEQPDGDHARRHRADLARHPRDRVVRGRAGTRRSPRAGRSRTP